MLFLFGLADLLARLAERLFLGAPIHPPYALGLFTDRAGAVGLSRVGHASRGLPGFRPLRWLYAVLFSAVGLAAAASGGVAALQWLFAVCGAGWTVYAGSAGYAAARPARLGLSPMAVAADQPRAGSGRRRGRAVPPGGRFLRRLYLLTFSGAGVALATLGLIGVQTALFTAGCAARPCASAGLAAGGRAAVALPLGVGRPPVRRRPARRAPLGPAQALPVAIIFAAVNTVIVTAGLTLEACSGAAGCAHEGQLGISVAVILAALALWVYHALVLRGDIARAGESALQGGLQRLYGIWWRPLAWPPSCWAWPASSAPSSAARGRSARR